MIENDAELAQTIEPMDRMYRGLANLRAEIAPPQLRELSTSGGRTDRRDSQAAS